MKQTMRLLALALALFLASASLAACEKDGKGATLNSGLVTDSSVESDDMDIDIESVASNSESTVSTGSGSASSNKSSSSKSSVSYVPPGETTSVDPNEVKLPDFKITNKKVKLLTRNGEPDKDIIEILKKKYGLTVAVQIVPAAQINATLINLVNSGNSPDLFVQDYSPTFVGKNLVQEIGSDLVNFDSALWKGVKKNHDPYQVDGKRYYIMSFFPKYLVTWYNKKMFVNAGLQTPLQLFNDGKWDWTAFESAAKRLTQDTNKDGTPEVYGYGWDEPELFLYSTGKHIVSYNSTGKATNNMRSQELARFTAWSVKLHKEVKQYTGGARLDLPQGKVAMVPGHVWYGSGYGTQIKNGTIEFAPLPKDPSASKYYVAEEVSGIYIPVGAKNVLGAAAYLSAARYTVVSPDYFNDWYDEMQDAYGWSNAMKEVFIKQNAITNTVPVNWTAFNIGQYWGEIFNQPIAEGKPWSSVVEEIAPKVDYQIKLFYEQ